MKELKLTEYQWKELVDSYDVRMDGVEFYLNVENGELLTLTEWGEEEEEIELRDLIEEGFNEIYYALPQRESYEGYQDMVDFTETVSDEQLSQRLNNVLSGGKKIFRRFKDTLAVNDEEMQRYYAFCGARNEERVKEWLKENGFEVQIVK
jgi:Uncharacterised protein family (UPF0158).